MVAYCLFDNIEVFDQRALAAYADAALPTVLAYGGDYVVRGGPFHLREGSWTPTHPVMIRFPSISTADAWYESPEYSPLKAMRQHAGNFNAVFIEGVR